MSLARAFWVVAPGRGEIRAEPLASPGPGEVQVRALYSGVSRGTESLIFRGAVPESQREAMRGPRQVGDLPGPVKYGYISVGEVEVAGPGAALSIGQRVFCLHPHQDRYVLPASAAVPLPGGVPPARAVLAANLETAINGVWDARPGPGDRAAVIGAGVVGCLVAWLIGQIPGAEVTLVDLDPGRAEVAAALGVGFAQPDGAPGDLDLVVHASGSPAGLSRALSLAGVEATVLEMSWFGDRSVSVPLGEAFHARRLTIRSSQVGRLPPDRAPRWSYRRRVDLALSLLRDPRLDALISGESDFEAMPEVMPRLTAGPGPLCHRIRYPGGAAR